MGGYYPPKWYSIYLTKSFSSCSLTYKREVWREKNINNQSWACGICSTSPRHRGIIIRHFGHPPLLTLAQSIISSSYPNTGEGSAALVSTPLYHCWWRAKIRMPSSVYHKLYSTFSYISVLIQDLAVLCLELKVIFTVWRRPGYICTLFIKLLILRELGAHNNFRKNSTTWPCESAIMVWHAMMQQRRCIKSTMRLAHYSILWVKKEIAEVATTFKIHTPHILDNYSNSLSLRHQQRNNI